MAWHTGDSRPLAVRYAETASELARLGEAPLYPQTEANLYEMVQIVSRKRPVVVDDEALRAAGRIHFDLRHRYQRTVLEIERLQGRLSSVVNHWTHRLLNDAPRGWDIQLAKQLPDTAHDATSAEVRQEVGRITPIVLATEALRDQLNGALGVDNREPEILHFQLLERLFARVELLERTTTRRLDILEDTLNRLGKRVRSRRQENAK
jgi:hypothetical protein